MLTPCHALASIPILDRMVKLRFVTICHRARLTIRFDIANVSVARWQPTVAIMEQHRP